MSLTLILCVDISHVYKKTGKKPVNYICANKKNRQLDVYLTDQNCDQNSIGK